MLSDKEAIAMIAERDVNAAASSYEGTLGLTKLSSESEEVITYRSGASKLNVSRSQYAARNKATSVVWNAGDELESIVANLKSKGVTFEHYDMPDPATNATHAACAGGSPYVASFTAWHGRVGPSHNRVFRDHARLAICYPLSTRH